jgi:prolyl-tRNA synthetase
MRLSQLFSQTLRSDPAEAEVESHRLLLRAGYIRQLAAGVFDLLPLARRSLNKIGTIVRQEMEAIGGQELTLPVVQPAELWQESGRWQRLGPELTRLQDRNGRQLVLGMTHEEVVADLARREIRSYRQLPLLVYQIQTKWRDEPRPRAGLIRTREFLMKDSYSLDADWEGLDRQYRAHYQAYQTIFRRCGLEASVVESDVGMMGGQLAHEFMFQSDIGEDLLLLCRQCGYAANREVARFRKPEPPPEAPLPLESVATPDCKTIAALANFLGLPQARTAKAVFLMARLVEEQGEGAAEGRATQPASSPAVGERAVGERLVFAIVRGDMEVNEVKLANALRAAELRPATEAEVRAAGAEPGYASPVGLRPAHQAALIVVDELLPRSPNLVAGANQPGYHLRNVNYGRDYSATIVADITSAGEGHPCPQCGAPLRAQRAVELGHIFK